jgi:formylmethanofuran dehydrogenase subunit C
MTGFALTAHGRTTGTIELAGILPERLGGLGPADVARLAVCRGGRSVTLGDAFDVKAEGEDGTLLVRTAGHRVDGIGQGMIEGRVVVEGDAGDRVGARMRGGVIAVRGSVGTHAGAAMSGGAIDVRGDAGDFLAAALPAEPRGMTGGLVTVRGGAGARTGERMRRGMVIVDGPVGAFCGAFMVAGTVAAGGGCGPHAGYGMRRGTLLFGRATGTPPRGFVDGGRHDLVFLRLLSRHAGDPEGWLAARPLSTARRWIGDVSEGGLGEILVSD